MLPSGENTILSENECWEFFADNMAPFASSGLSTREPHDPALEAHNAKLLVQNFFQAMGEVLQDVPVYKVF